MACAFAFGSAPMQHAMKHSVRNRGCVAAVLLSLHYAAPLGFYLPGDIAWPALRTWIAVAIIVIVCLFAAAALGWMVHKFIAVAKLSGTDRMLGAIFGLLR